MTDVDFEDLTWPSNGIPAAEARSIFGDYLESIGYRSEQPENGPKSDRFGVSPGFETRGGAWILPNGYTPDGEPVILKSRHSGSGKAATKKAAGFARRAGTQHAEIWTWDMVGDGFEFVKLHVVDATGKIL